MKTYPLLIILLLLAACASDSQKQTETKVEQAVQAAKEAATNGKTVPKKENVAKKNTQNTAQKNTQKVLKEGDPQLRRKNIGRKSIEDKFRDMNAVEVGEQMPKWQLKDINGSEVNLAQYKGKLLVIDMWATWCGPCLKQAPHFAKLAQEMESDKVAFISVSLDGDFAFWKKYLKNNPKEGTQLWAGESEANPLYWLTYMDFTRDNEPNIISRLPTFVIISPEGEILANNAPSPSSGKLKERVEKYLGEI